ncbi:AcrR family transcriptional regulator [Thermocatellispora tengchongensis]|uniref:AcrR family transcriptional regulator n=1 Tax=Thermocatellispora tengchongensis TaxID=1073253 RepID=A0A840P6N2_9ACTN|nr:TetR/AcrR family transcriptional regulator [Thermocatellispora tengchongensis]MBB5133511.1 AcrR family transcriptional regulator [Thermocatellispora tengchongensis]
MAPPARQRILDATARLLRERGLARLTTREIAQAADVAEGSITKNFGGKIGLLIELLSQELPELRAWQQVATPPGQRPMRDVLIDLLWRGIDYYAASLPLIAGAAADQDLFAAYQKVNRDRGTGPHLALHQVAGYLAECREAGELPRDSDPHALALVLCGTARFEAYSGYISGGEALPGDRPTASPPPPTCCSGAARDRHAASSCAGRAAGMVVAFSARRPYRAGNRSRPSAPRRRWEGEDARSVAGPGPALRPMVGHVGA